MGGSRKDRGITTLCTLCIYLNNVFTWASIILYDTRYIIASYKYENPKIHGNIAVTELAAYDRCSSYTVVWR